MNATSTTSTLAGTAAERARSAGMSLRTQGKLDRLAKLRPDLLEPVRAGRLSAHAAAIKAGFIKVKTPAERQAFIGWCQANAKGEQ
jgi:hypothetical protein